MNAGSEPIGGERGMYLPPADLFRKLQEIRVVYVTGESDERNLRDDQISRASLKEWCVLNVGVKVAHGLGHEALDPPSLERALSALEEPSTVDARELARCNADLQRELASKLRGAAATIEHGDREGARALLKAIDGHYGGLAAPAILELDSRLAAMR